jgi:hypothetical protein
MGLKEKRLVADLVEKTKAIEQSIQRYNNNTKAVIIEVEWPTIEDNLKALEYFEYRGLGCIDNAVYQILYDDIGKKAVQEGLDKVIFSQTDGAKAVRFENKILYLSADWGNDSMDYYHDSTSIQQFLEDNL